jgi:phage tail-like protein
MSASTGQLITQREGEPGFTIPLTSPLLTIGRSPENDVALLDDLVSRHHAELQMTPEGVLLTDLGSSNGTFIDDVQLLAHQPRMLTDGARFRIGPYTLIYRMAGAPAGGDEQPDELPGEPITQVVVAAPVVASGATSPLPGKSPLALQPLKLPEPPRCGGPVSSYLAHLPIAYQDNAFLGSFLLIFEALWEPLEQRQTHIDMYFDPRTAPARFLPWLASWLDVTVGEHWPEGRVRELLTQAMDLYRWRGTHYGLAKMIEIRTGVVPTIREDPAEPFVFRVSVTIPPDSEIDVDEIEDIIREHKPAHAGYVFDIHR